MLRANGSRDELLGNLGYGPARAAAGISQMSVRLLLGHAKGVLDRSFRLAGELALGGLRLRFLKEIREQRRQTPAADDLFHVLLDQIDLSEGVVKCAAGGAHEESLGAGSDLTGRDFRFHPIDLLEKPGRGMRKAINAFHRASHAIEDGDSLLRH